ncbi:hypothetical protein [Bacillus cereus]|uniref:hypothetical protein n=1 Tax=Bacillus cereus TaxID=1396 RepID=UPI0020D2750A|nr:hypothetical protein [Bacillus cereus]
MKWFTKVEQPEKKAIELIVDPLFIMVACCSMVLLAGLPWISEEIMKWKWSQRIELKLHSYQNYSQHILKYGTALALTIQICSGTIFAPEIPVYSENIIWVVWLIIFFLFIPHPLAIGISALGIISLYLALTIKMGFSHTIDYIFYLSISITLFLNCINKKHLGIAILYVGTSFSLLWVAMEKIVYPSMSIDIIMNHNVPTFGFAPDTFVLLCAFIEFIIGYLFLIGILNRTLSLIVTIIFMLTTMLFGAVEIIGHFMLHIVFIVFLIEGGGGIYISRQVQKQRSMYTIFLLSSFPFLLLITLICYYIYM